MSKFFNKFFSNPNKMLNITCAVLSILVFALCIVSAIASFFSSTYEGSSGQSTVETGSITNDIYQSQGETVKRDKITFTKEADGTFGQTATNEALLFLTNEKNRAFSEGGVETEANGIISANSVGIDVVQTMNMISNRDILGNIFYQELTKEVSSTGFGPKSCLRVSLQNDTCRYEKNHNAGLNGNKPVANFTGDIKTLSLSSFLSDVGCFELYPLSFTTDKNFININNIALTENFVGYTLTYEVLTDGNEYVKDYETKLGSAAKAMPGTTKLSNCKYIISFNKYGQILSYDVNFEFTLKMDLFGGVKVKSNGSLRTVVKYKNASYVVEKF